MTAAPDTAAPTVSCMAKSNWPVAMSSTVAIGSTSAAATSKTNTRRMITRTPVAEESDQGDLDYWGSYEA